MLVHRCFLFLPHSRVFGKFLHEVFLNDSRTGFEAAQGKMQVTMADCGGADDECTVRDGVGKSFVDFGGFENFSGSDGGARVLKRHIVGMHEPKMCEPKIADGARSGADV